MCVLSVICAMVEVSKQRGSKLKDSRIAIVSELPTCDFCGERARYDGATNLGPWAFMCQKDWVSHGVGLGLGKGQVLMREGSK